MDIFLMRGIPLFVGRLCTNCFAESHFGNSRENLRKLVLSQGSLFSYRLELKVSTTLSKYREEKYNGGGRGEGNVFLQRQGGGIRSNLTFPVLNNSDYNMEIIFNETINLIYLRMLAAKLFKYFLYKMQTYLVFTDLILYIYKNLNEEIKHRFSN